MHFVNQVTLCGKVIKDPIFATIKSNKPVCKIIIVIDKDIGSTSRSDYIPIAMWGKKAEVARDKINRGDSLVVIGTVSQERWETSDGEKRSRIVVQADKFIVLPEDQKKEKYRNDKSEGEQLEKALDRFDL